MSRLSNRWRWSRIRAAVLARDGYRCTQCGSDANLEVDHLDPSRGDELDNLTTVCRRHHPRAGLY
jgi:5-methylcytosine-specific restriction endonuclease McrA